MSVYNNLRLLHTSVACGKFSCFKEFPSPQRCNKSTGQGGCWLSPHVATAKAQESLNSEGACTSTIRKLAAWDAASVVTSKVKTIPNSAVRRPGFAQQCHQLLGS